MIDRMLVRFWGRVAESVWVPPESLGIFRWVFGLYLLFFDARWFAWIDHTPDAFFAPPIVSIAYLAGGFPPPYSFTIIDVVGLLAIFSMTCGYRTRLSTWIVLVTYLVSTTFSYSHGKISHQIAIAIVLACMVIADWGKASRRRVAQGLTLLAVALCFGFLTAGFDKALYWLTLDPTVSGALSWYYPRMALAEPQLFASMVPGTPLWLLKGADFLAVVFELSGFIALIWGRLAWRLWLLAAIGFHLANALVLNITFTTQVVVYLAFANLAFVASWATRGRLRIVIRRILIVVAASVTTWHIVTRLGGGGSSFFLGSGPATVHLYDLIVCVTVCLFAVALMAREVGGELARVYRGGTRVNESGGPWSAHLRRSDDTDADRADTGGFTR